MIRHQLAVYSPISAGGLLRAAGAAFEPPAAATARLSALLRQVYEADEAILVGSGSQALQLAITESARSYADAPIVALPAFTCYDVATAAVGAGFPVILFDVNPATLEPDFESVRAALQAGARIVVVSPLYGFPVDWTTLTSL